MEHGDDPDLTGAPRFRRGTPARPSAASLPSPVLLVNCPGIQGIALDLQDLTGQLAEVSLDLPTAQNSAVAQALGRISWSVLLADGPPSPDPSLADVGLTDTAWSSALFLQALVAADMLLDAGFAEVGGIAERLAAAAVDGALARARSPFRPSLRECLVLHRRLDPLDDRWLAVHEFALDAERHHVAGGEVRLGQLRPVAVQANSLAGEGRRADGEADLLCLAHWAEDVAAASDFLLATSDVADPDRATTATRWHVAAEGWRRAADNVVERGADDRAKWHLIRAERCDHFRSQRPPDLDEWPKGSYMTQLLVEPDA